MVQHMIKLVASDLDGTLLQNGAQELTPRALDLVRRLMEKGIVFVASSGRQYDNEVNLFKPVKDQISYIAENGSICIHKGNVISRTVIAPELIRRIIDEVKKDGRFEIVVSREDACFIEDHDPDFVNHIVHVMKNTTQIVEDVRDVEGPILKIAICNMKDGPHIIDKYLHHLKAKFSSEIKVDCPVEAPGCAADPARGMHGVRRPVQRCGDAADRGNQLCHVQLRAGYLLLFHLCDGLGGGCARRPARGSGINEKGTAPKQDASCAWSS